MKIRIFIFAAFFLAGGCRNIPSGNIKTDEALLKYSHNIKDQSFMVFPEVRENPIKWFDSIPERKIREALKNEDVEFDALPGEFFVFQIGVWALKDTAEDIQVKFSGLTGRHGNNIPAGRMTCFNTGGIDFRGNPFTKKVNIAAGRVKALWMGIDLDSIPEGSYKGSVSVICGGEKKSIPLKLKVKGEVAANHGYNEGSHMARLNWLNSTVGFDDEVTRDFIPVKIDKNRISILGRTITIGENGLPESIYTYFGPSNQTLVDKEQPLTASPFRFVIQKENGETVNLNPGDLKITESKPSGVIWKVVNTSADFDLEVTGRLDFDGFADFSMKLVSRKAVSLKDIYLEIPVVREKSEYMMGLGHEGGYSKPEWKWKWDPSKNQDMIWIGAVNGGLRIKLKAENYVRPLLNVYYSFGPLNMPTSWYNDGMGGINIQKKNKETVINAYSGKRSMQPGEQLNFNFELLITPFRLIDRNNKFGDRYFHGGGTNTSVKVGLAREAGANIINIHHAEDIYPFINYPYLDANVKELRNLVAEAHNENIRLKLYYTTRELTKNLPEFWAFNSLDGEIIYPGPGNESRTVINPDGPNEWLVKNLKENYIPAWYNEIQEGKFKGETDLSVITTPDSRLNNFYVAGLDWMVQNLGIDGVYIDDSALDRLTLMRARKIIDRYRPEGRMDLHSWNHFNKWAGFASCLNLYMDLLPYFDLVWIGEGRDYNRAPDHWLIEVSGIPFGLPGQMLEGGGNPWRGMVYGITNRAGYLGNSPSGMWKFWDEYNIKDKTMIGYWEDNCPVSSRNPNIRASVYKGTDMSVISIANWSDKDQPGLIEINRNWPGINNSDVEVFIPFIAEFQDEDKSVNLNSIIIPAGKGYIIVLKNKKE